MFAIGFFTRAKIELLRK